MRTFLKPWAVMAVAGGLLFGGCDSRSDSRRNTAPRPASAGAADAPAVRVTAVKGAKSPVRKSAGPPVASASASTRAADAATTEPTVVVSGRVTTPSGDPASSTAVALRGYSREEMAQAYREGGTRDFKPRILAEVVTDAEGAYEVRGPILDTNSLYITGDHPAITVSLDRKALTTSNKPKPGVTRLKHDIKLVQPASLSGQVVNENGQPVAEASVRVYPVADPKSEQHRETKFHETTSTASGAFELKDLAVGQWYVGAKHPEYVMTATTVTLPTAGPLTLQLSTGGATVAGRVLHKGSESPAAGLELVFAAMSATSPALTILDTPRAKSGSDGAFRLDHLRAGNYSLGLLTAKGGAPLYLAPPAPGVLTLADGETTELVVYVYPGHTIRGRVFDKDTGESLPGAKITVSNGPLGPAATSGADGTYVLEHVAVQVSRGGIDGARLSVELDGYAMQDQYEGSMVVLPRDSLEATKDIALVQKLMVRGVVETADGKPVPHAQVQLMNRQSFGDRNETKPANSDGTFELATLPFTKNVVEAEASGFANAVSAPIEVVAEDVEGVKVVMEPGATIEGTILDPDGQPVAEAKVQQRKDYGDFTRSAEAAVSDAKGVYTISNVPRTATLSAEKEGYATSEQLELTLSPGEVRTGVDISLRPGFSISGRVVDTTGKPVPAVSMHVTGQRNTSSQARTETDGKFEAKDLPEGTYTIYVFHTPQKTVEGVKAGTKDLEIVVGEPDRPRGTNTLIGTVVDDETSKPLKEFVVADHTGPLTKLREPGQFQISGLEDNHVRNVEITSPGYEIQKFQTKPVRGGQTIHQEFRMGKGGAIAGRVVDGNSKKPMPGVTVINWGALEFYERSHRAPKGHTITDAKGTFVLAPAMSGKNSLEVKPAAPYAAASKDVQVKSGETTDAGDIEVNTGGTITVQVVRGSDEEPVAGQRVNLNAMTQEMQISKTANTNEQGEVVFEALPAGNYSASAGSSHKSVVLEKEGRAEVRIKLGSVTMRGQILRGGTPVRASLSGQGPDEQRVAVYAQNGTYEIKNVMPGQYEFSVHPQGASGTWTNSQVKEAVEIPDQAEFNKDFILPDGRMEVTVTDTAGELVAGATVRLTQKSTDTGFDQRWLERSAAQTQTDSQGKGTFEGLTPGTFAVSASKEGTGNAMNPGVTVVDGTPAQVHLQLSKEGGTLVSVAMSYATGQGLQEAWCYLHGPNGPFTHSAQRGADGVMTIENIPPGTYTTNVSYWSHSQSERTVEIKVNETVRIEDVLYPAGAIHWNLTTAAGNPARGAAVTVTPLETNPPETETRTGHAGSDGNFVQRGLAAGTYQVTAQWQDKPAITENFTVIAGDNVQKSTKVPSW